MTCHHGTPSKNPIKIYHQKLRDYFYNAISEGNLKKLKRMIKIIEILQPGFLLDDFEYGTLLGESNRHFKKKINEEIIHYLFTCNEWKAPILEFITLGKKSLFKAACTNGDLKTIRFLLTYPTVKVEFNLNEYYSSYHYSLYMAFINQHMDVVSYLLFSKELKENINIEDLKNSNFFHAFPEKEEFYNSLDKLVMLKELEENLDNNDVAEKVKPKL